MVLSDLEICKPTSTSHNKVGISRSGRDLPPAHYLFKIESYSELMNTGVEKYETNVFQAGGYKWRLILYPSGNIKSNGNGYVSLYLAIADTEKLSSGWEVDVNFKLFVFNQKNNNYLTIQDADGTVRKFQEMKTEWGFEQLISLETLLDSSNGYHVEDSCLFGAEVFVISRSGKWESLSMVKEPPHGTFTWKIGKFSTLEETYYHSKSFTVGERDWNLRVYPRGIESERGKGLSVYLQLTDCERFPAKRTVYAKFKLGILDQLNNKYHERTDSHWFRASGNIWGFKKLVALSELYEAAKGYIKDDTVIVEVQILVMSIAKIST
ncbi:MATH domain and coiled-coil domain-containing protein At3g58370-like isoform X2 [Glycine soja]|uniref:Ubiquitin carboxyl-terminal hydrolase 13 n=1 Tax=Glycine soja TaxID=3848 RepID=A0A445LAT7_GLYSO|nr:MATH domain and coiled-coil domain-containing protein At3g58370-like isoform X2 [Glycine soja]RZC20227.1 Ubiquitin carboxyl-terminal hydrolase 13 [Glycine soja]